VCLCLCVCVCVFVSLCLRENMCVFVRLYTSMYTLRAYDMCVGGGGEGRGKVSSKDEFTIILHSSWVVKWVVKMNAR